MLATFFSTWIFYGGSSLEGASQGQPWYNALLSLMSFPTHVSSLQSDVLSYSLKLTLPTLLDDVIASTCKARILLTFNYKKWRQKKTQDADVCI
jgi:hypothetical protein